MLKQTSVHGQLINGFLLHESYEENKIAIEDPQKKTGNKTYWIKPGCTTWPLCQEVPTFP